MRTMAVAAATAPKTAFYIAVKAVVPHKDIKERKKASNEIIKIKKELKIGNETGSDTGVGDGKLQEKNLHIFHKTQIDS